MLVAVEEEVLPELTVVEVLVEELVLVLLTQLVMEPLILEVEVAE
jgi:hypothetical protein